MLPGLWLIPLLWLRLTWLPALRLTFGRSLRLMLPWLRLTFGRELRLTLLLWLRLTLGAELRLTLGRALRLTLLLLLWLRFMLGAELRLWERGADIFVLGLLCPDEARCSVLGA